MSNRSKKYGVPGEISERAIRGQKTMFAKADKLGFSLTVLHELTDIPRSTLKCWADGTAMPITGLAAIAAIEDFPNELLSLILNPAGKSIHDSDEGETDYDDLARHAIEFVALHAKARHPSSPGSIRIVHSEEPDLRIKARGLKAAAKKVAA